MRDAATLYIRFRKKISIRKGEAVYLGQVAQLICDPEKEAKLKNMIVARPDFHDGNMLLIDMMHVVRKVRELYPSTVFELFGEPHVLVHVVGKERSPRLLFIIAVWLLLFVGSGLAIMNFHADVSMLKVHQRIYELLTGSKVERPYLLQIPYSLGIGLGMVLFFNHLFKKKFNEEPSPLEVEMFMYQENLNHYVIAEEYGKMREREDEAAKDGRT